MPACKHCTTGVLFWGLFGKHGSVQVNQEEEEGDEGEDEEEEEGGVNRRKGKSPRINGERMTVVLISPNRGRCKIMQGSNVRLLS